MRRLAFLLLTTLCSLACGNAEVVTPAPLRVVDTYPSNGALVPGGDVPLVVIFSAPVDDETLPEALLLEEVADSGTPIRVIPTALAEYLPESLTANYTAADLPADTAFSMRIVQETVRAEDGSALLSDFVRRFKTVP